MGQYNNALAFTDPTGLAPDESERQKKERERQEREERLGFTCGPGYTGRCSGGQRQGAEDEAGTNPSKSTLEVQRTPSSPGPAAGAPGTEPVDDSDWTDWFAEILEKGAETAISATGALGGIQVGGALKAGAFLVRGSRVKIGQKGNQLFRNLAPADEIVPAALFPTSQIQKVGYSGRLAYVVTQSGELVIGRTGHITLSRGLDVLAAGEARFVNGALRTIDNASGHYRPIGVSAQNSAEAAFRGAGFSGFKYIERTFP